MTHPRESLPDLPLLLWKTPPSMAGLLAQEGVAHRAIPELSPLAFRSGRFVLHDARTGRPDELRPFLKADHVLIDVRALGRDEPGDPFDQLDETAGALRTWRLRGVEVTERVARHDRAGIRRRLLGRLREAVDRAGGLWARVGAFPHPYRSAFNLRVDLDEPRPDDYFAFARARRPIDEATTHFVSTHAYGDQPKVLADLRRLDAHSHGHYHAIYREPVANRVNLRRAQDRLLAAGIDGTGFAAPHGRWNPGLDAELRELGCTFAGEFQLGHDDFPFFPRVGGRASTILQVPVHPICEGLFLDGDGRPADVIDHLLGVVRAKCAAGEPAFVYGHPERRLGRHPEIVEALAEAVVDDPSCWKVGLGPFADWWRWRLDRSWSLRPIGPDAYRLDLDGWDARYPMAIEVVRGRHVASVAVDGPDMILPLDDLAYERRPDEYALPTPLVREARRGLKDRVREALDWETATPVDDLPAVSVRSRIKRELRLWRERPRRAG